MTHRPGTSADHLGAPLPATSCPEPLASALPRTILRANSHLDALVPGERTTARALGFPYMRRRGLPLGPMETADAYFVATSTGRTHSRSCMYVRRGTPEQRSTVGALLVLDPCQRCGGFDAVAPAADAWRYLWAVMAFDDLAHDHREQVPRYSLEPHGWNGPKSQDAVRQRAAEAAEKHLAITRYLQAVTEAAPRLRQQCQAALAQADEALGEVFEWERALLCFSDDELAARADAAFRAITGRWSQRAPTVADHSVGTAPGPTGAARIDHDEENKP